MKFLLVTFILSVTALVDYTGYSLYRFEIGNEYDLNLIQKFVHTSQLDAWTHVKLGSVDLLLSPDQQKEIPFGLKHNRTIQNLQKVINNERIKLKSLAAGFTESYHSLNEIYNWMEKLKSNGIFTTGTTYEKRPIKGIKFKSASSKKAILVHGGIHAREWISTATVVHLIEIFSKGTDPILNELLKTFEFHFIPVVNGDGYEFTQNFDRMWRKNRQPTPNPKCIGTDPNRNWGFEWRGTTDYCSESYPGSAPFSTPETKSIADYIKQILPIGYLDLHAYGQMWMGPYGYSCTQAPKDKAAQDLVAKAATKAITGKSLRRYKQGSICNVIYQAYGSSVDWAYSMSNVTYPYGVELPDTGAYGFILPVSYIPSVGAEMLAGLKALAQMIKSTEKL